MINQLNSNLIQRGWIHESGDDLNNYFSEGRYTVSGDISQMLNVPSGFLKYGYGNLLVFAAGSYKTQVLVSFGDEIWFRLGTESSWKQWNVLSPQSSDALWGNVTINTEVITQNLGCQWQSVGDVCTVYIQGHIKIPEGYTDYLLASDLPKLKFGYEPIGLLQEQDNGRTYVIRIAQNGNMYIRSDANPTDGAWVRGTIVYVRNQ